MFEDLEFEMSYAILNYKSMIFAYKENNVSIERLNF